MGTFVQSVLETITYRMRTFAVNPVRNSSGALAAQALAQRVKPRQIILECNPVAAAGPEGAAGHYF